MNSISYIETICQKNTIPFSTFDRPKVESLWSDWDIPRRMMQATDGWLTGSWVPLLVTGANPQPGGFVDQREE